MTPRLLPSGERALLLEFDDLDDVLAHYAALTALDLPDVVDVVPAARTILVTTRSREALPRVRSEVLALRPDPADRPAAAELEIGVRYDGPDLPEVAVTLGLSVEAAVRRHTEEVWTVAFCGFAPGFAYLTGTRFPWSVPRLQDPRPRVPAGAVGLAGEFSGVYPRSSPGGWRIVGHTDVELFRLDREPPALLTPGTRVRFRDVTGVRS